jgi:hypothetical protein
MNEFFGVKRETATGQIPIFQAQFETAQGGFTLDESVVAAGAIIKAGTVIAYDEATRKAKPFKGAVLQAAVTNVATSYPVLKGHNLAIGMTVNLPGGTARAITGIVTTDPNFDTIQVATTIGVAANAGIGLSVTDTGSTGTVLGLLRNDVEMPAAGITATLSVVIRGTVYERRIPPVSAAQKALMPTMIFSQSF